jgi:hypothetical protein
MLTKLLPSQGLGGSTNHGVFIFVRIFVLLVILLLVVVISNVLNVIFIFASSILHIVGTVGVTPVGLGRLFIVVPSAPPSTAVFSNRD